MLRPPMGPSTTWALLLAAAALLAAGCGIEEELDVKEGEPVEVGGLEYNVQLTRFLNPSDREDRAYLAGRPKAPPGKAYLGVFVRVENEGDEAASPPAGISIGDTLGNEYEPVRSRSLYALDFGAGIPPGGHLPAPDSPAASGPVQGALVLFLVDAGVTENRPLELEIPGGGGPGKVELDI